MTAEIIQLSPRLGDVSPPAQPSDMRPHAAPLTLVDELRRARVRILQLESSLTAALRDSVRHHDRAMDAERRLESLQRRLSTPPRGTPHPA